MPERAEARPCGAVASMMAQVLFAAFFLVDVIAVVLALANLHRQRCMDDYLDLRYRDHPDRHRRLHLRR